MLIKNLEKATLKKANNFLMWLPDNCKLSVWAAMHFSWRAWLRREATWRDKPPPPTPGAVAAEAQRGRSSVGWSLPARPDRVGKVGLIQVTEKRECESVWPGLGSGREQETLILQPRGLFG